VNNEKRPADTDRAPSTTSTLYANDNSAEQLHVPEIPADADTLTAALLYAKAGWYVGPAKRGTKNPGSLLGNGWHSQTSRDPEQIIAWFAGTDDDVFLHCGRSGAVVIDLDDPDLFPAEHAEHLDVALHQSSRPNTPRRGHYVYLQPAGRNIGNGTGRLGGKWGEVRGLNGVIMAAPSHHDNGEYRWQRTGLVPALPAELAELLPDGSPAEDAATDEQVAEFIHQHTAAARPKILAGWVRALNGHIEAGKSRHESAVSVTVGAMKEARAGYFPASQALEKLKPIFIGAVGLGENKRTGARAENEWNGIVAWAVGQANGADLDEVRARTEEKMPADNAADKVRDRITYTDRATGLPKLNNVGHTAQLRFAHYLAEAFTDELLYVHNLGWHRWDGARWQQDNTGQAHRNVYTLLRAIWPFAWGDSDEAKELAKAISRCETANGVAGILGLAQALPEFAAAVTDLDADPYLLNVANGTLDLRTLELRPHNPADRITKVCRGAYRSDAESPLWEAFLGRIQPDAEVRGFLRRLTGVGLLGEVREHVLPIWTGTGANGKSALDKSIRYSLGDYSCTAEPDLFMHREGAHPTGEMDLRGVRWAVVSESDKGRKLAEATMKRLTGGDTIRARRMRQDFVEFTPSHTATLITNHLPKVSGDDPAIWRRLRVVPFNVVIPEAEQDHTLDARLQLEADAVLAWAVAGWHDYQQNGLNEPDTVNAATDTYHRNSDAVARFIEERCTTGSPALQSTAAQLHEAWDKWRVDDGAESLTLKAFSMALTNKGFKSKPASNGKRWIPGIALKPAEDTCCDD